MPRINITSVLVDDQEKALRFYLHQCGWLRPDATFEVTDPHGACCAARRHPGRARFLTA